MISIRSNNISLKYQRFMALGSKDIGIEEVGTYDLDRKNINSISKNHSDITTYSPRLSFATFEYS